MEGRSVDPKQIEPRHGLCDRGSSSLPIHVQRRCAGLFYEEQSLVACTRFSIFPARSVVISSLELDLRTVPSPGGEGGLTVRWRHLLSATVDPKTTVLETSWYCLLGSHRPRSDACPTVDSDGRLAQSWPGQSPCQAPRDQMFCPAGRGGAGQRLSAIKGPRIAALHPFR
jgi:hypothetical protein